MAACYKGVIIYAIMELVEWKEDFESGVSCIDTQHKELLNRINSLIRAVDEGKGTESLKGLFVFLDDYVIAHFGTEQEYMAEYEYPEKDIHIIEHTFFIGELNELKASLRRGGPSSALAIEAKRRLLDWFIEHITTVDIKLCAYLKERI